jgi:hemoglobin
MKNRKATMTPHMHLPPQRRLVLGIAAAALALLAGCMAPEPAAQASLYDRLGGKPAITAVVDEFIANVAANPEINGFFATTDIPALKGKLVDQICEASGGPCTYTGKDMKTAHAGMAITEAQFNSLVGDLVKALDKFQVPEREKNELLGALGGMKGDIVGQ